MLVVTLNSPLWHLHDVCVQDGVQELAVLMKLLAGHGL